MLVLTHPTRTYRVVDQADFLGNLLGEFAISIVGARKQPFTYEWLQGIGLE